MDYEAEDKHILAKLLLSDGICPSCRKDIPIGIVVGPLEDKIVMLEQEILKLRTRIPQGF